MRHRQTTGAGPSGARPSIAILLLTAVGGGLAAGLDQPAGAWAGYGTVSAAALIGCGTLWQQRGLLERRAKEMARRRRVDLDTAATAERGHLAEVERVRAELEHEQQYSVLIQDQLSRAREQLERERAARRAAERELDALTGADAWQSGTSSVLLTVEEPRGERGSLVEAEDLAADQTQTAVEPSSVEPSTVEPSTAESGESGAVEPTAIQSFAAERIPARPPAPPLTGLSAAQRRGWQVVDGEGGEDEDAAEADRLYRPFIDQLSAAAVPVSDAALAMAPVIGAAGLDGLLDLTAYDETVEFSVRELKGMA